MTRKKIAGIMRSGAFSPNHVGNDAAIFHLTADQLRRRGYEVNIYSEEQFLNESIDEDVIVTMCRESASIEKLERLEEAGRLVINSSSGIDHCIREKMTSLFRSHNISQPQSLIVNTNESLEKSLRDAGIESCWVKRGDEHLRHKEDSTYCRNASEAQEVLHEYFLRGIRRAVINRHLQGEWVKFYGLIDGSFFYWYYPFASNDNSRGREDIEDTLSTPQLEELCRGASSALGVEIYGGALIFGEKGELSIVDFHDWPSFAPCRREAAPKIAKYIISRIKQHNKRK